MSKKILIVDDDIGITNLIKVFLETYYNSYTPEIATDPFKAYELIKNNGFDLVISDTEMPDMTGLELKAKLNEDNINVPFIGTSGRDEYEEKWRKLECDFLKKPYSLDKLKKTIEANL